MPEAPPDPTPPANPLVFARAELPRQNGIKLRDYAAVEFAKALIGSNGVFLKRSRTRIMKEAYQHADDLLTQRA